MRQLCVAQTSLGECADDAASGRGGTSTMLFNAVYGYDASGNVTAVDDRTPGASQVKEYVYDPLDRLTEWRKVASWSPYSATTQEAYTNDKIGNMTSKTGVTITAPATARYGFEAYTVYSTAGQCYCFAYAPNTGAWVFSGAAGVSENGSCLTSGNPPTPNMTRTAFL
jgi:YD repeat-containing protein